MKRMARLFGMVMIAFCLMTAMACGKDNPLVGKWSIDETMTIDHFENVGPVEVAIFSATNVTFTEETMALSFMDKSLNGKYEITESNDDFVKFTMNGKDFTVKFIEEERFVFEGAPLPVVFKPTE